MCLILIAINPNSEYKLIFLANRDEYYNRDTEEAKFWDEYPNLLAGKDKLKGGTWCGITKQGKFSAVTNFRELSPKNSSFISRGKLVSDFLCSNYSIEDYYKCIVKDFEKYDGFNFLFGNVKDLYYCSNRLNDLVKLNNGIYGLSNNLLDTPWHKVKLGKGKLNKLINENNVSIENMLAILSDETPAQLQDLPNTGIGIEFEKMLSPIFIRSPIYGTRSSTVILIDQNNNVEFTERTFDHLTNKFSSVSFNFTLNFE